jgi:DNA (cytosine-5)-methyltransferase 1
MTKLESSEYSFFGNINDKVSIKENKVFKSMIEDFINCIYEVYCIDKNLKDTVDNIDENLNIINFLIDAGIIKSIEQLDLLKSILKDEYNTLLKAASIYVENPKNDNNILRFMDSYRKNKVQLYLNDRQSPTLVDFFCGAGGLSLGFHREGFKILLANDIEEVCIKTYSFNHYEIPKSKVVHGDIKNVVEDLDALLSEDVDIVVGGPPCQGFSMANRQRIIDDPRNVLYKYYVKGIEKLKPKFFVMENVKGMLSVAEQVKEDFHNLVGVDYDVDYCLFNAKDFSVPQNRERLIYIGVRSDIRDSISKNSTDIINEIKDITNLLERYVLKDALEELRDLQALTIKNATEMDTDISGKRIENNPNKDINRYISLINDNKVSSLLFNHKARYNNDRDIEIFGRMLPGDKSDSPRIADIMPYTSRADIFKDKYYKLKMDDICKTITAHMKFDCNMYIHPNQARGLTPREAARVQSYSDDYFFLGPYTKTYMQIGNSVPPQMSNIFAKVIKKYIKE